MTTIRDVKAREILDSRGNPTLEVDILLEDDIIVSKYFMYYILQTDSYVVERFLKIQVQYALTHLLI